MLLPYSLIINLVLIREECEIVDQHSENAEGEGISKVEEEPKISYTEDTEVDVPSIPLSLLTLGKKHSCFLNILFMFIYFNRRKNNS